jgi:hypothetical protein
MEKKVLLNDLVGRGTHIRTEVTPKVVIADGSHPKGEIWDANKMKSILSDYCTKAEVEALIAAALNPNNEENPNSDTENNNPETPQEPGE